MSSFKNVAVFGVGQLGTPVVEQLLAKDFSVTVLGRSPSNDKIPAGAQYQQVDYTSNDSLVDALRGKDVAIATLSMPAIPLQAGIIDACVKAGVKRFIPADFGALTTVPEANHLPFAATLIPIQEQLKEKAKAGELEWTIVSPGLFWEFLVGVPLIIDLKGASISLHDEGKHSFSVTSVVSIAKAIVAALQKPEESKNRNFYINDAVVTQAQILALAKKHSPPGTEWKETAVDNKTALEQAEKGFAEDPSNFQYLFGILVGALLSGKHGAAYPKVDNELLGLPILSEDEIESRIVAALKQ